MMATGRSVAPVFGSLFDLIVFICERWVIHGFMTARRRPWTKIWLVRVFAAFCNMQTLLRLSALFKQGVKSYMSLFPTKQIPESA
jgi:hypothetical protein